MLPCLLARAGHFVSLSNNPPPRPHPSHIETNSGAGGVQLVTQRLESFQTETKSDMNEGVFNQEINQQIFIILNKVCYCN